jgi:hypothetical protein
VLNYAICSTTRSEDSVLLRSGVGEA